MTSKKRKVFSGALAFILLMGIVSMFSDMTHEGGGKQDYSLQYAFHGIRNF